MSIWILVALASIIVVFSLYACYLLEGIDTRLIQISRLMAALKSRIDAEDIPSGKIDCLINGLLSFLNDVESGKIPSMRADDWVPTVNDRERAEKAQAERAEHDRYLGPFLG